jgi:peptidoglycan L-alanyl-D-glutamate endopeptidase CwlK
MKLSEQQQKFSRNLGTLLTKIFSDGYEVTFGEVLRTQEMQDIYLKTGKSKTSNSMHLKKCAVDLNFFKDGVLVETPNEIGKYWESLDPLNRWGGSWRGLVEAKKSTFIDKPHFERYV